MEGLSSKEAARRLGQYGKNVLERGKKRPAILLFFQQFADVMTLILIGCSVVSAFMGDKIEAIVMIGIVVANAFLGFIQEFRTEKTIEALTTMTALRASVLRDGKTQEIPAERIVPGDVVLVKAGDILPADGMLMQAVDFRVDESMLTGESEPVSKTQGPVYGGTQVVFGNARIEITETGMHTEMGKISSMLSQVEEEDTPLQKRLSKLGKYIVLACLAVCLIVTISGILKGEPVLEMLLSGISLAVAAVPEGLTAIVTISLALGVQRLCQHNALVRKLSAVETLGGTTVICSDKTGTLTQNKMTLRKVVLPSDILPTATKNEKESLVLISTKCNNQSDATERALLETGTYLKVGAVPACTRIYEFPFDSNRKCMSVAVRTASGEGLLLLKGGADIVVRKCDASPGDVRKMSVCYNRMAGEALRVMGFAWRKLTSGELAQLSGSLPGGCKPEHFEQNLTFAGFCGLADPPRPEAKEAIALCKDAGIRTVMITGDHKSTASAIATELGLPGKGRNVLTGDEIESMQDEELVQAVEHVSVFARVRPIHKLRIVRAFKSLGHIVAMTGDGVNDAPAVKEADIGICMGGTGSDVTKEAAAMILVDDRFVTITEAVRQGRAIFDNIRKFIRYMLACNLGEVITMFVGVLAGLPLPLYPIQILWVNLVTDGLPGIALGLDPPDQGVMLRPPIRPDAGIFTKQLVFHIVFRGILTGLCTLGAFVSVLFVSGVEECARTAAFLTLVLVQLVHAFECRSDTKSLFEMDLRENGLLVASVGISLLMMVAVIYIPVLQGIFRTVPLPLSYLPIVLGFTLIGPLAGAVCLSFMQNSKRKGG